MSEESLKNDEKPWLFKEGNPGGGRPLDTPEQKIAKKVMKEIIKDYKERLAQALPEIEPILIAKAVGGDIQFIKELHDRVMGKPEQKVQGDPDNPILPILVKFIDERQPNNNNDTK